MAEVEWKQYEAWRAAESVSIGRHQVTRPVRGQDLVRTASATSANPRRTRSPTSAILGGGTTQDGTYFVRKDMRSPLYEYADVHGMACPIRSEAFTQVCDASQYANQNVIHRDIKPQTFCVRAEAPSARMSE